MKRYDKNIAAILVLVWLIIFFSRFEFIFDLTLFFAEMIKQMFLNTSITLAQIDFELIDFLLSLLIFLATPALIFILMVKKNNYAWINSKVLYLLSILWIAVSAPILAPNNPEVIHDLNSTKLLKPFTSLNYILKQNNIDGISARDGLVAMRKQVFTRSSGSTIFYFDSIEVSDSIRIQKGNSTFSFSKNDVQIVDEKVKVNSKFFILGTDEFGRDVISRILYGMRISVLIGFGSVIICFAIGISLGFIAGYFGKGIDLVLSRVVDLFLTFPSIFLVVLALALFGNNMITVILVLGFTGWMSLYKIVKGEVISVKQKDFFLTAKKIGLSYFQLLKKEVIPVIVAPVLVNLTLQFSNVVLAESALSYLGLGVGLNYPSLGAMLNSGQEYLSKAWWMSVFPGATIIFIIFVFNSIAEKLNAEYNSR